MPPIALKMPGDDTAPATQPSLSPQAQAPVKDDTQYSPAPDPISGWMGMVSAPKGSGIGGIFKTALHNIGTLQSDVTNLVPNLGGEVKATVPGAAGAAQKHPIITNLANDTASILSAPAEIIAHPIKTVENFVPATVQGFKQAIESATIPFGGNPDDIKSQWAAHPGLQVLNLVSAASILGGVIKGVGKAAISSSVSNEAVRGATQAVSEGAVSQATADAVKSVVTPKFVGKLMNHITGNTSPALITDMVNNAFTKAGLDATSAAHVGQATLETIADHIQQSLPMKMGQTLAHPIDALSGITSPVTTAMKSVFSKPSASAVSYLFGDDAIKENPTAFAQMEESASQQLQERGIEDTVQNRIGIMSDWAKTNPDWAALSTGGKALHMQNFAETTPYIKNINETTGKTFVPIKALSPDDARAAISDINDMPGELNAPMDVHGAVAALEDTLGDNIGKWKQTILQAVANNPTKQGLIDAVTAITRKASFNFSSSQEAQTAAQLMEEQTGYRVGVPPEGKPINFVSEQPDLSFMGKGTADGTVPSTFTNDTLNKLLTHNNRWQAMLDRLGLSTQGAVGSGLDAMYGDQFGKNFTENFGEKYADGVKLPRIVVDAKNSDAVGLANGAKTIPQSGLYSYLARNLNAISRTANSVGDLTSTELQKWGFSPDTAKDITSTARKSLQLPIAATGVGQGLVNFLRANFPGYNGYLNRTVALKYNSPLAVFYQARVFTKFNILRQFATGKLVFNLGDNAATSVISRVLQKMPGENGASDLIRNIIAPPISVEDAALMNNTVWRDSHGSAFDMATSPEVLSYVNKEAEAAAKTQTGGILTDLSGQSQKGLLSFINFSVRNDSITLAKGLASKYGMDLRDALSYDTLPSGQRVYRNPAVYNNILDTIESTYHYQPGFLTSPMIRNINTVFYPLRFEAKVMQQTAAWMGRLSPIVRGEVMLNLTNFASWAGTPSGKAWLDKNQTLMSRAANYLLPFDAEGKMLKAAVSGKFFDGNLGELGGIPFAFPITVMKNLSLMPGLTTEKNPDTGKEFTKSTPKNLVSQATAETALEDLVTTMLPSFPLYSILGKGAPSIANFEHTLAQKIFASVTTGSVDAKSMKNLTKQFKTVPQGYFRGNVPNPLQTTQAHADEIIPDDTSRMTMQPMDGGDISSPSNYDSTQSRPVRNNNPLDLKDNGTSQYSGVVGTDPVPASDGGKFLRFDSPEAGYAAASELLKTDYAPLSVNKALRIWSNKGYGGEIVPELKNKKIGSLTPEEFDTLVRAMAKREGYTQ